MIYSTIQNCYLWISGVLLRRIVHSIRISQLFNEDYYLQINTDVLNAGIDPILHYLLRGRFEGRSPGSVFLNYYYVNIDRNNNSSFLRKLYRLLFRAKSEICKIDFVENDNIDDYLYSLSQAPELAYINDDSFKRVYLSPNQFGEYEEEMKFEIPKDFIKLIALYLPQYHPFKENDLFWGKGFTEWTNTTKALPRFEGHYQPKLPGELGFYDLRNDEILKRQIELAKQYGIYGFCIHYYHFNGKVIMNEPLNRILKNKKMNIPFCLHWANETWSAKFDGWGSKGDILIKQSHTPDDDNVFLENIIPIFKDYRYITIDNKPLLLIYRPELFPDIKSTISRWNELVMRHGFSGLYLVMAQTSFTSVVDPFQLGFDAAFEFPPHRVKHKSIRDSYKIYNQDFKGYINSYSEVVEYMLSKKTPKYTLFRGIMPGWDNTARVEAPYIYPDSTPEKYQEWLTALIKYTREFLPDNKQFIFINAWNEWAEGAYLEPDRRFGYAYLNSTARALCQINQVSYI